MGLNPAEASMERREQLEAEAAAVARAIEMQEYYFGSQGGGPESGSPDTDVQGQTSSAVQETKKSGKKAGTSQSIKVIVKTTTGRPTEPLRDGVMEINYFDNKIFMYADGGWRELAVW